MSAQIFILPVVRRVHFQDPAWREQMRREAWARTFDEMAPPLRTRPIALPSADTVRREARHSAFAECVALMASYRDEQLIVGQRPEQDR